MSPEVALRFVEAHVRSDVPVDGKMLRRYPEARFQALYDRFLVLWFDDGGIALIDRMGGLAAHNEAARRFLVTEPTIKDAIAKSMAAVSDRRKRGRPRKPAEPRIIGEGSFDHVRKTIERMMERHKQATDLLTELRADNRYEVPRETYNTACELAAVGQRLHNDNNDVQCWCDNVTFEFYYPSEVSWKEARKYIDILKAASLYLSIPYPDTTSMTDPGSTALGALATIQRFANK